MHRSQRSSKIIGRLADEQFGKLEVIKEKGGRRGVSVAKVQNSKHNERRPLGVCFLGFGGPG